MHIQRYTEAPAMGPYSPVSGVSGAYELLVVASQIAIDEDGNRYTGSDVATHTWLALHGLKRALESAGSGLQDVLRITAITNFEDPDRDRTIMNEVYERYFDPNNLPSRTYIGLPLISGVSVAFDAMAAKPLVQPQSYHLTRAAELPLL